MRTLKFSLAAVAAALAFHANAQGFPAGPTGMGPNKATGLYQTALIPAASGGAAVDEFGFHAGGVAACDGCHVMHNAGPGPGAKSTTGLGASVAAWSNVTNMYLLQGSDQSSTCLICHAGTGTAQFQVADLTSAIPGTRTPGGDFGWLRFNWANSPSQRHGHNVAAADFSIGVDPNLAVAPGGTWAGAASGKRAFACSSCHDPHGRYRMQANAAKPFGVEFTGPFAGSSATLPIAASGSYGAEPVAAQYAVGAYRVLAGQAYAPASNPSFPFPNDPPIAVAPTTYNQSEAASEVRVAYGRGMSEWCQNCHTNIHLDGYTSGVAGLRHPAGSDAFLHAGQYNVYNTYKSSGIVEVNPNGQYTSLVPFEQTEITSLTNLKAKVNAASIIAGPQSAVMCLSCHRAHATAFDSMVRWDQNATFMTGNGVYLTGLTNGERTTAMTQAGYYDRAPATLGNYQRSLCNKCHGKD